MDVGASRCGFETRTEARGRQYPSTRLCQMPLLRIPWWLRLTSLIRWLPCARMAPTASPHTTDGAVLEAPDGTRLSVYELAVTFRSQAGDVPAVQGISFELKAGETLAIVGESGSGKTQAVLALTRLTPANARITGSIRLEGAEIANISEARLQRLRGARISYVFQDPMTALNPYLTIGTQLMESLRVHERLGRGAAKARAISALEQVRVPDAQKRLSQYPHELSGGMRQRVMIAMALSCRPGLLIADEPTTALDVTVQAQILDLLDELRRDTGTSILLITHDMGVVARLADRVAVMYAGRIVETANVSDLFAQPCHPYTQGLLASMPRIDGALGAALSVVPGQPPDPAAPPAGCPFRPRCAKAFDLCSERPLLRPVGGLADHAAACHLRDGDHGETSPDSSARGR